MDFKYRIVYDAVPQDICNLATSTLLIAEKSGRTSEDSQQVKNSSIIHGHELCDSLLLMMHRRMERETRLDLIPTYSFARIYRKGNELIKHTDRPSCEISTTLTLGFISDRLWSIYADDSGPIGLPVGSMLIYKGCEVEHWREPFKGDLWVQVFLHYVDANGPHKDHAFDKREIGPFYETIYNTFLMGK